MPQTEELQTAGGDLSENRSGTSAWSGEEGVIDSEKMGMTVLQDAVLPRG